MLTSVSLPLQRMFRAAAQPQQRLNLARRFATVNDTTGSLQSDIFKPTKYGGKYTVTLIPGDGIGAEVAENVKEVFKADNVPITWEQIEVSGLDDATPTGRTEEKFQEAVASLRRNKLGLKGILHTPISRSGHQSFNVAMRQELDIYASIALIKNIPGLKTRHDNINLCIIRENTEGEYSGLEHQSVPGVVESLKIITRAKSERISKFAFSFALANGRKKVTCIHKANIMKLADGLFLDCAREAAKRWEGRIASDDVLVDALCMKLVRRPADFDVLLLENLYGDIVSDLAAGLVGGLGLVPGANYGREAAVFEAVHGSAPDIAGKGVANPIAMILSAAMMCHHLGQKDAFTRIRRAVAAVTRKKESLTPDIGGTSTTRGITDAIIAELRTE